MASLVAKFVQVLCWGALFAGSSAFAAVHDLGGGRYRVGSWPDTEKELFYYSSTGGSILPADWLDALELPASSSKLSAPENLEKLGFSVERIGDRARVIGFAETDLKERYYTPFDFTGKFRGLNCAGCHTGELHHEGKVVYVDGGSGRVDISKFIATVKTSLAATARTPSKFWRFFGETETGSWRLAAALESYVYGFESIEPIPGIEEGPGRSDTVSKGASAFAAYEESNRKTLDAPVSIPGLWETQSFDRYHVSGGIRQKLGRDISATTGGGAATNLRPGRDQFNSAINIDGLRLMEELVARLAPPEWPEAAFGPIAKTSAERGRIPYANRCASCHEPKLVDGVLALTMVPVSELGTDSRAAMKFRETMIDARAIGLGYGPASALFQAVTTGVMESYFDRHEFSEERRNLYTGGKLNLWDGDMGYKANPLKGIWATPPYLHNGSVVSLRELLMPATERTPVFQMCVDTEYDPAAVGYVNDERRAGCTVIDARGKDSGNGNHGHEYGVDLSGGEKADLIEYLKTL